MLIRGPSNTLCCFRFILKVGDFVEAKLGQERDIVKVLRVAEAGNKREKRVAAFELATLAAFSEDNKFLIGN